MVPSIISISFGAAMIDATILGAGVLGLSVATEIVARGGSVRLFDPKGAPNAHACSWWAGGMLAPFCEAESAEEPVMRLGQLSAKWWEKQGVDVSYHGSLVLALGRDVKELDRFARRTQNFNRINGDQISELEPDLAGRFQKALFFESEAHLNPRNSLKTLVDRLKHKGVEIKTTGEILDKDLVIDCRGLSANDHLNDLRGVKGEMLVIKCKELDIKRPIRLLHPRIPLYIVPRGDGIYMVGATMIEASERTRITARSLLEMLSSAYALHPSFGEAEILEIGVDARPAFPDNLPKIRKINNRIYANGLYRHGYLLAPTMAIQIGDYLFKGIMPEFAPDFAPDFKGDSLKGSADEYCA